MSRRSASHAGPYNACNRFKETHGRDHPPFCSCVGCCSRFRFADAAGRLRAAPPDHREGSLLVRLGRRSADLAGRLAGRVRARQRRREEGRVRHGHLAGQVRRQRAAAGAHERHSRHQPALVARRPSSRVRAIREKDGRPQPPQIYVMAMAGGEPWAITDIPRGAGNPEWAPDGRTIAFSSTARATELTAGQKPAGDKPRESDVRVITEAVYRANGIPGDGFVDRDRPSHIWTVAVPATASDEDNAGRVDVRRVRASQSSVVARRLAHLLRRPTGGASPTTSQATATSTRFRETAANRRASLSIDGRIGAYALSPDGKRVAFVGFADGQPGALVHAARSVGRASSAPARRATSRPATTSTSTAASAATSARRAASCRAARLEPRRPHHPHRRRRAGQRQPQARRRRERQDRCRSRPAISDVMALHRRRRRAENRLRPLDADRRRRPPRARRRIASRRRRS